MARAIPAPIAKSSRDYELHAKNVYDAAHHNRPVANGWSYLDHPSFPNELLHRANGLDAALYQSDTQTILTFAGTRFWSVADWSTNFRQGFGAIPPQYLHAVELAQGARHILGASLGVTGHSLGGGLATYAGLK